MDTRLLGLQGRPLSVTLSPRVHRRPVGPQ